MNISREQWQMVVALLLVAVISTVALGLVSMFTKEPIAHAERQALMQALMQVLPKHNNDPIQDTRTLNLAHQATPITFYYARNAAHKIQAIAWEVVAPDGYSGSIHILMAVRPDGSIHAIRITAHKETPGLGDGIVKNQSWLDSFSNASLSNRRWHVKKDGGDFDQFTGATITPRAVVKAVKAGLEMFKKNQQQLLQAIDTTAQQGGAA